MNLTGTALGEYICKGLGSALRKSRSILSLHLSANPGLTKENREYLSQRIHAKDNEDMERFIRINHTLQDVLKTNPTSMFDGIKTKVDRDFKFLIKSNRDPVQQITSEKLIF